MPAPTRKLLYTPVRIETKYPDGSTGAGTSFVFRDVNAPPEHQLFLVSNKHVVEGASEAIMYFAEKGQDGQPLLGQPFFLRSDMFDIQWHGHSDPNVDVSVMPLSWQLSTIAREGRIAHIHAISEADIADIGILRELDVTAPVLFVGFPNGMFDEKHYLPIFRRGYVATAPDLDFNGEPVFLIDASVFPGSSGSPVFTVGDSLIGGTPALKLLGIVAAGYTQLAEGHVSWKPIPTNQMPVPSIEQMIDLGIVFKSRFILETIESFHANHSLQT